MCTVKTSTANKLHIEAGSTGYRLNILDRIINFTKFSLSELSRMNFSVPDNYREKLIKIYQENPSVEVILSQQPTLVYCIKYNLLKSEFLNDPKETRQIVKYFANKGWIFGDNAIQIALKRMKNSIEIQKHATKRNTNTYSKVAH